MILIILVCQFFTYNNYIPNIEELNNKKCRFVEGYYKWHIPIEDEVFVIHIEYSNEEITYHRVIDKFYVKNKITWTSQCEFELTTLEISDPILLDSDWVGKKSKYKIIKASNNEYSYVGIDDTSTRVLKWINGKFPRK